jgi:glycosyltransferase involved in cell wall biosynthesis
MRILHIDSGREMGGGQWQVLRLLRGLRERPGEHRCDLVLMTPPGSPLGECALREGFAVERVSRKIPAADLVHVHDARSHTLAALFARTPVIVARRVAFPVKRGWLSRWKYRRAAHFIAVSRFVAARLIEAGVPESKISIVHDGVPLLPLSTRDGAVIEMAKNTSNLEADLLHARMLVYLTEAEGLGSGALLGMSAGVPVIASRVGGLPEAIENGVNGVLTSNEPSEVAACVTRLQSDPVEAARLAANARRTIEERFTVERMVEDTIAVYRRILNV